MVFVGLRPAIFSDSIHLILVIAADQLGPLCALAKSLFGGRFLRGMNSFLVMEGSEAGEAAKAAGLSAPLEVRLESTIFLDFCTY